MASLTFPFYFVKRKGYTAADLHILVFDGLLANSDKVGHGVSGYYFGENGELSWYDIAKAIGKAMVKHGVCETDEPSSFTSEELLKYLGNDVRMLILTSAFNPVPNDDFCCASDHDQRFRSQLSCARDSLALNRVEPNEERARYARKRRSPV